MVCKEYQALKLENKPLTYHFLISFFIDKVVNSAF